MKHLKTSCAALIAALTVALPASAHITFTNKEVTAGAVATFVLRVPHGCAGKPTTGVRLAIPKDLSGVVPQEKAGWTLTVVRDGPDGAITEMSWNGGSLDDKHREDFAFRATVSASAIGHIVVPIIQQCDGGVERWIETPSSGTSADDLKYPAPSVRVKP